MKVNDSLLEQFKSYELESGQAKQIQGGFAEGGTLWVLTGTRTDPSGSTFKDWGVFGSGGFTGEFQCDLPDGQIPGQQ